MSNQGSVPPPNPSDPIAIGHEKSNVSEAQNTDFKTITEYVQVC